MISTAPPNGLIRNILTHLLRVDQMQRLQVQQDTKTALEGVTFYYFRCSLHSSICFLTAHVRRLVRTISKRPCTKFRIARHLVNENGRTGWHFPANALLVVAYMRSTLSLVYIREQLLL